MHAIHHVNQSTLMYKVIKDKVIFCIWMLVKSIFFPCINFAWYTYTDHICFIQKLLCKIINTSILFIAVLKLSRKQETPKFHVCTVVYHQLKPICHKRISLHSHKEVTYCKCIIVINSLSIIVVWLHTTRNVLSLPRVNPFPSNILSIYSIMH